MNCIIDVSATYVFYTYIHTYVRTVKYYEYNFCVSVNDIIGGCGPGLFGPENVLNVEEIWFDVGIAMCCFIHANLNFLYAFKVDGPTFGMPFAMLLSLIFAYVYI